MVVASFQGRDFCESEFNCKFVDMDIQLITSFLVASVILTLMPGPDNIFVLSESLTKGKRNGLAISLGLSLGLIVHTIAAASGLSIVIQKSAVAFSIIKYLGAAYLFYLAYQATKEKTTGTDINLEALQQNEENVKPLIRKGFLMNILNPKVSLFFIAFFPQFVTADGFHIALQMIILGLIFMLQAMLIFSSISLLSGRLSKYVRNPRFWKVTKWTKFSVLSLLGLTLAVAKK